MFNVFHFCRPSYQWLDFNLVPLKRNYTILSYILGIKRSSDVIWGQYCISGCNIVGKGLSLWSPHSRAILRLVAAISNIFFMASKERIFISFPNYPILGPSNVFNGKTGSLPNIRKKGDSFECSLGMKL